ncbi:DUF5362 family protein [Hwangdonia lutea]|uniref:DUF5362 family protein n=1 Tax=Hwangdonia lutea TaxID=3075823 RepID=A0AA97HR97_9FLAO|nr:DUF5362 family protein [Hwangdonia sp. SCSIO 19198]WOD43603.1 DUF5362 family protein [Hwangdonia sp. SCSIO 19198]
MEQKSVFESFELEIGEDIKGLLKETSSWSYLLSIIGFIGIGLMVIAGIFLGAMMGANTFGSSNPNNAMGFSMGYFGLIYVGMGLIYFFPVLYLFNFSRMMKKALSTTNKADLKSAFTNLKSHYKFMDIFAIVIISIYVLMFLGGMLFTSSSF